MAWVHSAHQWHRGGASDFTPSALTAVSWRDRFNLSVDGCRSIQLYRCAGELYRRPGVPGRAVRSQPPLQITARMANELPQGTITITGDPRVGRELSFENATSPMPMALAHSAINGIVVALAKRLHARCALTAIAGATGLTYLLVEADEDSYIAVEATFTDGSGTEESLGFCCVHSADRQSDQPTKPATGVPTIVGHPRVGEQTSGRRAANN